MSFSERQYRAREARQQMLDAAVADDVHRYRQRLLTAPTLAAQLYSDPSMSAYFDRCARDKRHEYGD